ncbi:hypothetical protein [Aquimarina sp. AD10]|uniref:hypothetical protein n=1 Tax=Aquimarina sp. AD10 TaxID=1714849 RepID=UPI001315002F|nr:hypothetical protein [Aquimarina sp. AD10]
MKTVKALFVILVLTTIFLGCEADELNDETAIEIEDVMGEDEEGNGVEPPSPR